ncbi:hypothetical protein [Tenacibaculum aquimarinum]|uniref:hypothetical protein n=1 Tax=Tenacibaculum aquimarinum TaxID=2910675 RepID=UPI001F0A29D4|nr:hypothetical protein [Tenacibaculum aquimarinum]MCH3883532.1 hypothetical protein [Tenacibaculum aquimarinum]
MKKTIFILFLLLTNFIYAQENFEIEINGEKFEIKLDKDYELKVDNKVLKVNVKQKDTLLYYDKAFNFKYPKEYKVVKSDLGDGIEQLMLMTAEGSGFMIQKYSTINPSMLNELMISEVTKESVNYGFELKRQDYERTLTSGLKLNVDKAVLTYKDDINIYEIATVGGKDSGVLIMTMKMDDIEDSSGEKLINLIWNTLVVN